MLLLVVADIVRLFLMLKKIVLCLLLTVILQQFKEREVLKQNTHIVFIFSGCFSSLEEVLPSASFFNGIVADFGVSSFQLEEPERGFSFRFEGPLDMRMSQTGLTAAEVINTFNVDNLAKIFGLMERSRKPTRLHKLLLIKDGTNFLRQLQN